MLLRSSANISLKLGISRAAPLFLLSHQSQVLHPGGVRGTAVTPRRGRTVSKYPANNANLTQEMKSLGINNP